MPDYQEERDTPQVIEWLAQKTETERARLVAQGLSPIPMTASNMGLLKGECGSITNRIEFKTNFNFKKVKQILVSDPVKCPCKRGYLHVYLVLATDNLKYPLLLSYLYESDAGNLLNEWLLINGQQHRVHHSIDDYVIVE